MQPTRNERYSFTHFAINYLSPRTSEAFEERLKENGFLQRSFGQQVFFSFLLREFDYIKRSTPNLKGRSGYINTNFELAGAEILALNEIANVVTGRQDVWRLGDGTEFSQYVKGEVDLRYIQQLGESQGFSARMNLGIALPFGNTTDVPYVKQFFVGGANSMRAWAPRGLGPGGFQDPLAADPANNFRLFQTGDVKLELNAEYRFPIFLWFNGALFVDAGNIWTLKDDAERPDARFSLIGKDKRPFYKEMAVAGGFGLRVDLSYFIFRFDVGMKLRYNTPILDIPNPVERDWWNDFKGINSRDFGFNFGLGMPF
ncbi:MAG: BamA/TamA family outer membrane protein [Saprospiraceae bacterium]